MAKLASIILLLVGLVFTVKAAGLCAAEDNFRACTDYVKRNMGTNCKSSEDYECLCAWHRQMVTCYTLCSDDPSKREQANNARNTREEMCGLMGLSPEEVQKKKKEYESKNKSMDMPESPKNGTESDKNSKEYEKNKSGNARAKSASVSGAGSDGKGEKSANSSGGNSNQQSAGFVKIAMFVGSVALYAYM
ncbi:hypothetical protein AX774_g4035 [Zancudomyces culisetae]|uniref:Extracellular membrane protein CFEM domain-containing protein n=1 Tax=Zancudomyces culisetae TaxID=1213189 RepID=A0A1R1PNJ4_ZANCU|nr:hypothetical protein AX774_g4035 [Zancudomyces culisetae]|eukprot:OMH82483.1 hypothetical protein AX774_g4035 [Zancudomyces culisetae]